MGFLRDMQILDEIERQRRDYRVIYLGAGAKRVVHDVGRGLSKDAAELQMRALKRRGMTAWVETDKGEFVPMPGARKRPRFNP